MVECGGLENRCAARHRGFKSYFLRQNFQARSLNGLFHSMHRETSGSQPFASSCPLAGRRAFHDPLSDPATQLTNQRKRFPWQSRRAFHDPTKDARQLPPCCTKGPAPSTVLQPQERASCMSSVLRGLYTRSATISSGRNISAVRRQPGSSGYPTVVVFTTRADSASDALS